MLCCLRYGWSLDSFVLNLVQSSNSFLKLWYRYSLPETEIYTAMSLLELIFVREGQFTLPAWFCKISNYFFNYCTSHCLILLYQFCAVTIIFCLAYSCDCTFLYE